MSELIRSSIELRFDELAALILKLQKEKCEARVLMAHFVPESLNRTVANLEGAGYWKRDDECSIEELRDRRLYAKPWYILGKYMEDLARALKGQKLAALLPKAQTYDPNGHRPLRDDSSRVEGMSPHV